MKRSLSGDLRHFCMTVRRAAHCAGATLRWQIFDRPARHWCRNNGKKEKPRVTAAVRAQLGARDRLFKKYLSHIAAKKTWISSELAERPLRLPSVISGRLTSGSRPGQAVPSPFCQRSKDEGKYCDQSSPNVRRSTFSCTWRASAHPLPWQNQNGGKFCLV